MPYCRQFNQFDPLNRTVPLMPFVALPEIAKRARELLHDVTVEQIIDLAETVEWIIDVTVSQAREEAEANDETPPERYQRSDSQWLLDGTTHCHIGPAAGARFPHEFHAFAVLALWLVADASFSIEPELDTLGYHSRVVPADAPVWRQWMHAGRYAINAMEAVRLAEGLARRYYDNRLLELLVKDGDGVEAAVRKRISVQAQAAAIKKHSTNRAARLRAIELYSMHNYPSIEAAAQAIAPQVFKAPRTVAKWIYDERKGRTPPLVDAQT
ncbi:hypothetical protein [Ralstonia solanacearum]|uniref:hypothetical protein n=2 Tax=Ralstonia solanacearum TaxID=305 RepID=UPI000AF1EEDA|nr:hypothetical protein [Ralstonia solanacearum]